MAVVPEYGGPSVMPAVGAGTQGAQFQAMAAPKADPMAPLMKAANEYAGIKAKIMAETDEAIATEAETQAIQHFDKLLKDPETGFMTRLGKNAVQPDKDGVSPVDAMMSKADSFVQGLLDGKNKNQSLLIKKKLAPRINALYGSGMQHAMQENHRFIVSASEGALEYAKRQGGIFFDQPDKLDASLKRLESAASKVASLKGESVKASVSKAKAEFHAGVATAFLVAGDSDPDKYREGLKYVEDHKNDMTTSSLFNLTSRLAAGQKNYESYVRANEAYEIFKSNGTQKVSIGNKVTGTVESQMKDGDTGFVMDIGLSVGHFVKNEETGIVTPTETKRGNEIAYGGSRVTLSMLKAVNPNATDSDWKKVREDASVNRQVGMAYLELSGKKYGEIGKSVAAYVLGQTDVDNAIEKAKKDGGVWSQYLSKESKATLDNTLTRLSLSDGTPVVGPDGKEVSPLNPQYASLGYELPDYDAVRERIRRGSPLASDPNWLDKTTDRTMKMLKADKEKYVRDKEQTVDAICTLAENNQEIPQSMWEKLTVREQKIVQDWIKKIEANDTTGSKEYAAHLVKFPHILKNMTQVQMRNAMRLVPKGLQNNLMKMWEEGQAEKQNRLAYEKIAQSGGTVTGKSQVTSAMVKRELKALMKGKSDAEIELYADEIMMSAFADDAIHGVDTRNKAAAEEYVRDYIRKEFVTDSFLHFFGKNKKSIIEFKYSDYTSGVQKVGKTLADSLFSHDPGKSSDVEAKTALLHILTRRTPQFSEGVLGKIIENNPSIIEGARTYLMMRGDSENPYDKRTGKRFRDMTDKERYEAIEGELNSNLKIIRNYIYGEQ